MLDGVQCAAFSGQHGARIAGKAHQIGSRLHGVAIGHQMFDLHPGIERTEECLGNRQAGNGDGIPAVHHAGKARIGWNHAFGRDVTPAVWKSFAEVFGQSLAHKCAEIVSLKFKPHQWTKRATTSR